MYIRDRVKLIVRITQMLIVILGTYLTLICIPMAYEFRGYLGHGGEYGFIVLALLAVSMIECKIIERSA